jgi:hypothetical protein
MKGNELQGQEAMRGGFKFVGFAGWKGMNPNTSKIA